MNLKNNNSKNLIKLLETKILDNNKFLLLANYLI